MPQDFFRTRTAQIKTESNMIVWRLTAAAAAVCLLASTPAIAAALTKSESASTVHKKQRDLHLSKLSKSLNHNRLHRIVRSRSHGRYALRHRKLHVGERHLDTQRGIEFGGREFVGTASYYWEGSRVASGARYNPDGLTAAHRTLPLGTQLRVTNLATNRTVVVTVNDRGPFVAGRVLDLSRGAARVLGMIDQGVARIRATVL
jgi:rare lipoprotein A